jgi:type IV pilus assembly protein PilE
MITIAVVAILASVALPNYLAYVARSKVPAGLDGLSALATRMEQYYQDTGRYGTATCGQGMVLTAPSKDYATLTCALTNGGQGFTATATGTGTLAGYTYTIDQTGARRTTSHPKGNNLTCWSIKGTICDA